MPRQRRSSPMRSAPRRAAPPPSVPARAPQYQPAPMAAAPAPMAAPRQPGMFAQMATTAAGVAVGSAVGHTIGHALTGGSGGGSEAPVAAQPAAAAPMYPAAPAQAQSSACQYEFKQFLECTQNQSDISLCQGFNEVFRQCQQANGLSPQLS